MFVHDIVWLEGNNTARSPMACKQCDSENQGKFGSEMAIHYPGLKGLDGPIVMIFQGLLVCLDCGFTEFTVPENELRLLEQDTPARPRFEGEADS
jgi:hypothetical protein